MGSIKNLVVRFVKEEEGASLVEYGLLVGLIAVVCIAAVTALGLKVETIFGKIDTALTPVGNP